MRYSCIALIPARSGSRRIKNKNIKKLGAHPLIAYTIQSALSAKIFSKIVVSTDSQKIANIARFYGAEIPFLRPKKISTSVSPDIKWVLHALSHFQKNKVDFDCFSILRPTNPFRRASTIRQAYKLFTAEKNADSLRAVERCSQHPAKMWIIKNNRLIPVLKNPNKKKIPWHNMQYSTLPKIYVQNASLEIAWSNTALKKNSISGKNIIPIITKDYEGYDINTKLDWTVAERLVKDGLVTLPKLKKHKT